MWYFTGEDSKPSTERRDVVYEENEPYEILAVSGYGAITVHCSVNPADMMGRFRPEGALLVVKRVPD
jgi:hypothetical protein